MMESQVSAHYAPVFMLVEMAFVIFVGLIMTAVTLIVYCKIVAKMAYNWALGLLMLVPIANLVLLLYVAFADWPIHRELRYFKQQCGALPA